MRAYVRARALSVCVCVCVHARAHARTRVHSLIRTAADKVSKDLARDPATELVAAGVGTRK